MSFELGRGTAQAIQQIRLVAQGRGPAQWAPQAHSSAAVFANSCKTRFMKLGDTPERMPTMQDVADHVGVSRQLVSLVLRDDPGPSRESRERILAAASELGYRLNSSARLLRQHRTRLIGTIFDMRNPFQVRFVEKLFLAAAKHGYRPALGPRTPERSPSEVINALMEERVDAVIAFNPGDSAPDLIDVSHRVPVVWLGEWTEAASVDNIHVDERRGLRLAVQHLVRLGHREIVYLGGQDATLGSDRARAYEEAMQSAGLEDEIDVVPCDFDEEQGAAAARSVLARERLPTALVCCGDQVASGVLAVLARAGVEVPGEMSVIGFDDSRLASLSYHHLTSVHQDVEATVQATLDTVLSRLNGEDGPRRAIATPTSLTVRETTAHPRRD